MPFYEYECSACKFYVEALQKISDPPMKKCPSCKKPTLQRLVSAPVFRLKGGGWYETDFKSEQETKRNLAAEEKEAAETKTEDKSDKPAEPAPAAEKKSADSGKTSVAIAKQSAVKSQSTLKSAQKSKVKAKVKAKTKPKPAAKKK